ncbi:MAG: hypothetical protein AVDCRST_MAG49-1957, partial [uncultured Thermomicrobiales bacterium]
ETCISHPRRRRRVLSIGGRRRVGVPGRPRYAGRTELQRANGGPRGAAQPGGGGRQAGFREPCAGLRSHEPGRDGRCGGILRLRRPV